ncbi:small ribosomal subunit Rsm22 family protein [Luteitalea sp.]|uniref:small ribosomal subunit Rsm22 family protein n=1 Tax=Luteitalea sp. TaxID=2004800 RepID=UPI0037CB6491
MLDAIDREVDARPASRVAAAAHALTEDYARGRPSPVDDEAWHAAYLATRLPATYAAVSATLAMLPDHVRARCRDVLDLGAGPGTATWAALAACEGVQAALQVDRSAALLGVGARLAPGALDGRAVAMSSRVADIGVATDWPAADLVISAYTQGELAPAGRARLAQAAWGATRQVLVLVEPGTPTGFMHLAEARTRLLEDGAHLVAPCPHAGPCPVREAAGRDWCHFSVRLPRTRRHRQLKGGTLGYEDEKFAYLVFARDTDIEPANARVLRHPRVDKGKVGLDLCTPDGLQRVAVTRRHDAWRAARKAEWGDAWSAAPLDA